MHARQALYPTATSADIRKSVLDQGLKNTHEKSMIDKGIEHLMSRSRLHSYLVTMVTLKPVSLYPSPILLRTLPSCTFQSLNAPEANIASSWYTFPPPHTHTHPVPLPVVSLVPGFPAICSFFALSAPHGQNFQAQSDLS